jgi:hypothetical protein
MNWKGEIIQAGLFLGLPLLGALAMLFAFRTSRFDAWSRRHWLLLVAAAFLVTRVGTHVLAFHVLGWTGGGDLERVWTPTAQAVLDGRNPIPHLDNLYGPLFPWVLGAGLGWTGGAYPPGIDLPFLVADGVALWLLWRLASRRFPEATARRVVLVVLLSPLVWFDNTVQTQDESLFACLLLLTLDLLDTGRERWACVAAAMGTVFTKALFPFWVFPLLLAAGGGPRRVSMRVIAAGALTVGALALAVTLGWNPLSQFGDNINVFGTTPWLLFVSPKSLSPDALRIGLLATSLGCVLAAFAAWKRRGNETMTDAGARGVVAVQGVYVVLSPFLLTAHLAQGLPFLAWQAAREGACRPRPSKTAWLMLAGFALWQVPSLALKAERWHLYPVALACFSAFWAWTAWKAWCPSPEDGNEELEGAVPPR